MKNWSTDVKQLKKDKKQYAIWHLEQLINFGLGKEKLKRTELIKYWPLLKIDPLKKRYLAHILWPKRS